MKRVILCFFLIFGFLFTLSARPLFATSLTKSLWHAIHNSHLDASMGVLIEDSKTHRDLFKLNATRNFIPASNVKLLTAIAALKLLGPNFHYTTRVYINKKQLKNHILRGNLVFYFTGDPTLTTANLNALVRSIKKAGVHRVLGHVVIDHTYFEGPDIPIGWLKNDLSYCYGAKASSVIINQNCMHVNLLETHTQKTKLIKFPDSVYFKVNNTVKMVPRHELKKCVFWPEITHANHVYLKGCLPPKEHYSFALAVQTPLLFAKTVLTQDLKRQHIVFSDPIISGTHYHENTILVKHTSKALSDIVKTMLQHSNNLYANAITRTLGKQYYGSGSFKAGVNAIKAILLSKAKVNLLHSPMEDGSGLSRYNLVSPSHFVSLMNYALSQPRLASALVSDLPLSGRSGTLYYRMRSEPLVGKVYAKTGSMQGISSLTGFMYTKEHHRIVFSIIMNNFTAPLNQARKLQDTLLHLVYMHVR